MSTKALTGTIEAHAIRPVTTCNYPVNHIREAPEALAQGGHFGKVTLTF